MHTMTFTKAVLRFLIGDPDTPETVRLWMAEEMDPDRRELLYAVKLAEDFLQAARSIARRRDRESRLWAHWLIISSERVNWRRVAELLLRRFGRSPATPLQSTWVVWTMPASESTGLCVGFGWGPVAARALPLVASAGMPIPCGDDAQDS